MPRTIEDLELNAVKFWPTVLAQREQSTSIIPKLIESQEKFIGILYIADSSPTAWKDVLRLTSEMPANLFLKHLIVLSDIGGEKLQRFRTEIEEFFSGGVMTYLWQGTTFSYRFKSLESCRSWTNPKLLVDGPGLLRTSSLTAVIEDVAMFLIHGGASVGSSVPDDIPEKCILGSLIGKKTELDSYVRQRYICVSRITGGATSNTMGQLCQAYVRERLQRSLIGWDFTQHTISGVSHNEGRTDMSFDLVAKSSSGHCCAIEVSFQVTTNSVIERKAGQAAARQQLLHAMGHRIAYVLDGAGNFQRRSALSAICDHSDCTVSFRDDELDKLVQYLRDLN